ncbi:MAG TPA: hypothetical protein EYP71_02535 [Dehalococcoidia bacterium]|nr:hypothetical protein [Dehalococcoidia bacterium]
MSIGGAVCRRCDVACGTAMSLQPGGSPEVPAIPPRICFLDALLSNFIEWCVAFGGYSGDKELL